MRQLRRCINIHNNHSSFILKHCTTWAWQFLTLKNKNKLFSDSHDNNKKMFPELRLCSSETLLDFINSLSGNGTWNIFVGTWDCYQLTTRNKSRARSLEISFAVWNAFLMDFLAIVLWHFKRLASHFVGFMMVEQFTCMRSF